MQNSHWIMSSDVPTFVYNDSTINKFMELIVKISQSQIYAFDTLLLLEIKRNGFEAVHRRIRNNLFEKTLLLAPFHDNNHYWNLAIIHVYNKEIILHNCTNYIITDMIEKLRQFIISCELKQYGLNSHWQIYKGETTILDDNHNSGPWILEIAEIISRNDNPMINLSLMKDYTKKHKQILEENILHLYHDPAQFSNPPPLRPPTPTGIKVIQIDHSKKKTLKNKHNKYLKNLRKKTRYRKYYKYINMKRELLYKPIILKTLKPRKTSYSTSQERKNEMKSNQSNQ
ncbi:sentrin-specific protease 1-like isoform X1 [Daktulosphaira vitifoliae]|uniref:sentrin-specific protease 1-like isoform X1 n=2 Tax=Daktulosphaira vitifoliae TaxID=58002 RepID=UPI0021A9CC9B|nr:sentrin-specific protease 1-like isoform X1 [Daktulosphaira vitifoliae]